MVKCLLFTVGVKGNRETKLDAARARDLAQELIRNAQKVLDAGLEAPADGLLVINRLCRLSKLFQPGAACCRRLCILPAGICNARGCLDVDGVTWNGCIAHMSKAVNQAEDKKQREQISSMASISVKNLLLQILIAIASISIPTTFTATVVEDLNNLQPPSDFNSTITNNCRNNPSLRYCNSTPFNLLQIFKSTIVASHLCKISRNPNCVQSFPKIDLRSQPKIAPLYLSFTFFWKYCPLTVVSIDLSNNSLKGNFPTDVFYCSQILGLDLSLNNLSGDVPVDKFSSLENLTFLNLSYNAFSECEISESRFFERFNPSSFVFSGILPDHGELRIKTVLFFVGFPVFVIGMVVWFGWFCFWRKKQNFTASILEEASHGFSKRNLVGKSSRSSIYRGRLRDGSEVRIEVYLQEMSRENRRRFVEQSEVLVQLDHRNIVRVLGWCDSRRFMAVVTEWMDGENIETWLKSTVPPWKQRVQVILAVAAGIRYLHEEWPGVGYNLKSRNILLSENGEPVISQFKFDDHVHHSSTKKIYEFGVLVLETVTSRRAGEDFGKNDGGFVEWVKLHFPGNLEGLIDRRMKTTAEIVSEAAEIVEFGLICTDLSSRRQPSWDKFCDLLLKISHTQRGRGHKHVHHRQH